MKVIVGLGNPGEKYTLTRHNVGALVVKKLAGAYNISLRRRRYLSRFGEGKIAGEDVKIIFPQTYMNLSGEAVSLIVNDLGIDIADILIVCDDADLKLGDIRMKHRGSDGGHKGLRSISENLKTNDFPRMRMGIGKRGDLTDHVLTPFTKDELRLVKELEDRAVNAVVCWIDKGIREAMNIYNVRMTS